MRTPLVFAMLLAPAGAAAHPATLRPLVMDDVQTHSRTFGADFMLGTVDTSILGADVDTTLASLELELDVPVAPNLEVAVNLPLVFASWDLPAPLDDDSALAIGNATAGVRLQVPTRGRGDGSARVLLGGFASLSLPTASDENEEGAAAATGAFFHATHDPALYLPNSWTLRAGGDLQLAAPNFFLQLGLAVHLVDIDDSDDLTLLRLGLCGGFRVGERAAIIGELSYLSDELDEDDTEDLEGLDLGVRWGDSRTNFTVRVYYPLDDDLRDYDIVGLGFDLRAGI